MQGGHEFFSSLFGEFLAGQDCSSVLQDPNADPMDKEVCSSLLQFQDLFKGHRLDRPEPDRGAESAPHPTDPQSLRDEILHRPADRLPRSRGQPDKDLDGEWSPSMGWRWGGASPSLDLPERQQPMQEKRYSSSTTVTIKRRPDGTYEEKRITRDSTGKEEVTTRVMDNFDQDHNYSPFYKRIFGIGPKNS